MIAHRDEEEESPTAANENSSLNDRRGRYTLEIPIKMTFNPYVAMIWHMCAIEC